MNPSHPQSGFCPGTIVYCPELLDGTFQKFFSGATYGCDGANDIAIGSNVHTDTKRPILKPQKSNKTVSDVCPKILKHKEKLLKIGYFTS